MKIIKLLSSLIYTIQLQFETVLRLTNYQRAICMNLKFVKNSYKYY